MFLGAEAKEHYDEREYKYPDNLKKELIPAEVIKFFDQIRDESIPSESLFKQKIDIELTPGVIATYGFGGVHQGLKNYIEESEEWD
jgi:hypothetical protein